MSIIGMTGSRDGMSDLQIENLKSYLKDNEIIEAHHGDCIGADSQFHTECEKLNIKIIIHPPKDNKARAHLNGELREEKDYLLRNKDIVNESDILLAFPSTMSEVLRSGTWSTIRYAKKINKKVLIFYPNGNVKGSIFS